MQRLFLVAVVMVTCAAMPRSNPEPVTCTPDPGFRCFVLQIPATCTNDRIHLIPTTLIVDSVPMSKKLPSLTFDCDGEIPKHRAKVKAMRDSIPIGSRSGVRYGW